MTDKEGTKSATLEELRYAHDALQTAHVNLKADWESLTMAHSTLLYNRDDVVRQLDQLRLKCDDLVKTNERLREQLGQADSHPEINLQDDDEGA